MNLLAVDDERYILDTIKNSVDWKKLDIGELYLATNAKKARSIISQNHIDIIICDIEMPRESGLELLLWVGEQYPNILSIILTCHADFEYIKDAIRLSVMDYLLKPVSVEELERAIQKAVVQINKMSRLSEASDFGRFWSENKGKLLENFWEDILRGQIIMQSDELVAEAKSRNLEIEIDDVFLPMLLKIYSRPNESLRSILINKSSIKDMARSAAAGDESKTVVVDLSKDILFCLFSMKEQEDVQTYMRSLISACEEMVSYTENHLSCAVYCYIGECCTAEEVIDARERLSEYAEQDMVRKKHVVQIHASSAVLSETQRPDPNLNILAVLLLEGSFNEAKAEAVQLLQLDYADSRYLHWFYQNFLRIYIAALDHYEIPYPRLFADKNREDFTPSLDSLRALQDWVLGLIDLLADSLGKTTVVSRIKNYIDKHLDEKLTRETLSKQVYLNPDYLNRLFLKECGVSLHDYITDKRIDLAKVLLTQSNMKVGAIAMNVGYKNFSQFSRAFRDQTGMSPVIYRNAKQENA